MRACPCTETHRKGELLTQIQADPDKYRDKASKRPLPLHLRRRAGHPRVAVLHSGAAERHLAGKRDKSTQEGFCGVVLVGTNNPSGLHRLIDFPHSFPATTALVSFPRDLKTGQRLFFDFPARFRVQYGTRECEASFHCLVLVKYEQGKQLIQPL